ncbi:MAG TPA: hypothetical protein VFS43_13050 [Polyangiaceae bacterium]|nr:hypothetical protein [Polyangiaceae bacterium]
MNPAPATTNPAQARSPGGPRDAGVPGRRAGDAKGGTPGRRTGGAKGGTPGRRAGGAKGGA